MLLSFLLAPATKKARKDNDCNIEEIDEQEDNEQSDSLCEESRSNSSTKIAEQNDTLTEVSTDPGCSAVLYQRGKSFST